MEITSSKCYFWTDSTVALGWIGGNPSRWQQFVKNRVTEIPNLSDSCQWNYCSRKENPTDLVSRGTWVKNLIDMEIWWRGPVWLARSEEWPKHTNTYLNALKDDLKGKYEVDIITLYPSSTSVNVVLDLSKCSSWLRELRVTAWIERFVAACFDRPTPQGHLLTEELIASERY